MSTNTWNKQPHAQFQYAYKVAEMEKWVYQKSSMETNFKGQFTPENRYFYSYMKCYLSMKD